MSNGKYRDKNVQCPFYVCESKRVITCEGIQKGTCLNVSFLNSLDKKAYKKIQCTKINCSCRISRMLELKYGD